LTETTGHKENSTEELILKAAKLVFTRKGMAGARMQEIADEAGINKALLHYYYRSKNNLFNAVFIDLLGDIQEKFLSILNSDMELFDKIRFFFAGYTEFLQKNSFLPGFIINEINQDPERMIGYFKKVGVIPPQKR
jgi:AcrR family transcriptional regulator